MSGHTSVVASGTATSCVDTLVDTQPCGSHLANDGFVLRIPPFWLPFEHGLSEVSVVVTQKMGGGTPYFSSSVTIKLSLELLAPGVEAVIAGIADNVGFGDNVILDAGGSVDLGRRLTKDNSHLQFHWTCTTTVGTTCRDTNSQKPLTLGGASLEHKLTVAPRGLGLAQGTRYIFRVTVFAPPLSPPVSPTEICNRHNATLSCLEACLNVLHCSGHPRAMGCENLVAVAACEILHTTYARGKNGGSDSVDNSSTTISHNSKGTGAPIHSSNASALRVSECTRPSKNNNSGGWVRLSPVPNLTIAATNINPMP